MLRLVDDFLIITTSRAAAESILQKMHDGFPEYGCTINPHKTRLNFDAAVGCTTAHVATGAAAGAAAGGAAAGPSRTHIAGDTGAITGAATGAAAAGAAAAAAGAGGGGMALPRSVWRAADGSEFIKWCGLLINAATLEIQADYTRYSGQHIATSLTLPTGRNTGTPHCRCVLCDFLQPEFAADAFLRAMSGSSLPRCQHCLHLFACSCSGALASEPRRPVSRHICTLSAPNSGVVSALCLHAGARLRTKLPIYLRPKCHALLLDTTINTPATVRLNVYQVLH